MTLRIDINAHDDTDLGAEVRDAYARGRRLVMLVDSSEPDQRAATWVDGTHGLWRVRCENGDVWLTALDTQHGPIRYKQPDCPACGMPGIPMENA